MILSHYSSYRHSLAQDDPNPATKLCAMLQHTSLTTPLIVCALNTILQLVSFLALWEVSGSNYVVSNLKHERRSTYWYYLNRSHVCEYDLFVAHFRQFSACVPITSSFASLSPHSDYRYLVDLLFLYFF